MKLASLSNRFAELWSSAPPVGRRLFVLRLRLTLRVRRKKSGVDADFRFSALQSVTADRHQTGEGNGNVGQVSRFEELAEEDIGQQQRADRYDAHEIYSLTTRGPRDSGRPKDRHPSIWRYVRKLRFLPFIRRKRQKER